MTEADPPRRGRTLEEWFTTVGTFAGGVAALGGFVYLVGGMVMWLRFRTADLPADQGVALMSKEQLFVVGLRLMIIPTLVTGTLAWFLADRATSERKRGLVTVGWAGLAVLGAVAALAPIWAFAVAGWPTGLAVLLDALIVTGAAFLVVGVRRRGGGGRLAALPRWLAPAIAATSAALVLLLCLAVPALEVDDRLGPRLAVAGAAIVALVAPAALLLAARLPRPRPLHAWAAAGVLVVAVGVVAASAWWVRVAIVLGGIVVSGVLAALALLHGGFRVHLAVPRRWVLPALAIVAVGLVVPWSFASATWPLGLGLLIVVWLWRRQQLRAATGDLARARQRRRLAAYMATTAVLAAAIVSIGRQLDEPVQLLRATVTFKEAGGKVEGAYVSAGGDMVYVGDQQTGTIQAIPRDDVRKVSLGPPEERAPSPSLLSRILPGEQRFSARPLEVWCDGERYGWFEAGKLCKTQPELLWTTEVHNRFFDRLGMPVRVRCPAEARDVCSGWVRFRSRRDYLHGPAGIPRPVVPDPVRFAVGPSKVTEVCATLTAGQLRLLRRESGEEAVPFEAVLAHDAGGETVLDRGGYGLLVGPQRVGDLAWNASDCEPRLTIAQATGPDGLSVRVSARPRAHGITPWEVEGAIRLSALQADGPDRAGAGGGSDGAGGADRAGAGRGSDGAGGADRGGGADGGSAGDRGGVLRLGTHPLRRGEMVFTPALGPGRWRLTARYTSVAGLRYSEPSAELDVVIPEPAGTARAER